MSNNNSSDPIDTDEESGRSISRTGTAAAAALAAGVGASGVALTAVAQDEDDDQDDEGEVVIHGNSYYPGEQFHVLAELETMSKRDLMANLDPDEEEFDDPDDWDVYSIRIERGGPFGRIKLLLVDTDDSDLDASPGDAGTFDETASFRSPELNLLETDVTLEEVEDDEEEEEDEEEEVDEEVDEEEEEEEEEVDEEEEEEVDEEEEEEVDEEEEEEVDEEEEEDEVVVDEDDEEEDDDDGWWPPW